MQVSEVTYPKAKCHSSHEQITSSVNATHKSINCNKEEESGGMLVCAIEF